jgi:hypothetical protein
MHFADGHVKAMSLTRSVSPTNYWMLSGSNGNEASQAVYDATAAFWDTYTGYN